MALVKSFGDAFGSSFLSNPAFKAQISTVFGAVGPALTRYKAANGAGPIGQSITLDNGFVGHFTPDGLFNIDYTPPNVSAAATAAAQAVAPPGTQVGYAPPGGGITLGPAAPPYAPSNQAPFVPPAAASVIPAPAPAATIFGLPPLLVMAGGGLVLFLIVRRL